MTSRLLTVWGATVSQAQNSSHPQAPTGTQAQTVWVDAREEGKAAVAAALAMADGTAPTDIEGSLIFSDGPMGVDVPAILLDPVSITQDNLGVLLEAGWISQEELCDGVEPGSVEACP